MIRELSNERCENLKIQKWKKTVVSGANQTLCLADELCSPCAQCPHGCSCLQHIVTPPTPIVDCTASNLNQIPKDIPVFIKYLSLDWNNIHIIPTNIFSNLSQLISLHLNNSKVMSIEQGAFNGLHKLEILCLQDNKIFNVSKDTFSNLPALRIIDLSFNHIYFIESGSFIQNSMLANIYLNGNNLSALDLDQFRPLPLDSIALASNPWSCICPYGPTLKNWLVKNTALVSDILKISCSANDFELYEGDYQQQNDTDISEANPTTDLPSVSPGYDSHGSTLHGEWIRVLEANFSHCRNYLPGGAKIEERTLVSAVTILTVSFLLVVLCAVLAYRKEQALKIMLVPKLRVCITWFQRLSGRQCSDIKEFDVFVAYSPQDWDFVIRNLVPRLQDSSHYLKVF